METTRQAPAPAVAEPALAPRAPFAPPAFGPAAVLALQRTAGNRAVRAMIARQPAPAAAVHDVASYYVWPRLTPEQETSLGGGADRAAFKQLNALSMSDMLDRLEGRKADVARWLGVPDYYVMAGPETNEERIWYAMRVVSTRKLPKRPEGKDADGNELVYEGQATEAQEWLDAHKKQ